MILALKNLGYFNDKNRLLQENEPIPMIPLDFKSNNNELFVLLANFSMNNWLQFFTANGTLPMKKSLLSIEIMTFYLYKSSEDPQKLYEGLNSVYKLLEEKFDFLAFYNTEISDQKKQKVAVLRFFKLLDLDPSIRKLLTIVYKAHKDINFLKYFISMMVYSYPSYKKTPIIC